MAEPPIAEYVLRLVLSALFGGIIGLEREFRMKDAGVRTHLIVSLASCMMMLVSKYGFYDVLEHPEIRLDPSRIAAGIVTAIGFIGAGTIFSRGRNVTGLTTAAGLWATVGIGMATGAGMYFISTFGTGLIITIQALLHWNFPFLSHPGVMVQIQVEDQPDVLEQFHHMLDQMKLPPHHSKYTRNSGILFVELDVYRLTLSAEDLEHLLTPLTKIPYIKSVEW